MLVAKVKTDYKLPNHYNLKMRWCQNGNADATCKFSPTVLADNVRLIMEASEWLSIIISLADIANFFQNAIMSPNNLVCAYSPP